MEMKDRIKLLREQQHLTLEEVGKVVGVGKSTVRKWETGDIANMRRDKIAKLAEALHTTPAYLMGWEYDPETTSAESLAVMESYAEERSSGREGAREAMYKTHGVVNGTNSLRLLADKFIILYYHAFDDNRSSLAASELLNVIEKLTPAAAEHLELLVDAYLAADDRARQMVDLALDPFLPEDMKDWFGPLVPKEDLEDAKALARQILQDKKAAGTSSASNGAAGKKKEA